ncbi:MAG TPA: hypothetical protein PK379_11430 [Candidatus Hydrogenedentes bacterium]|nr:hypothetical protein [Candidatus Hydrogenedentota bacterium]HOK90626.1 hypothetical protein [Candidatus Hydrogenedentota bacterium]HOV61426.1 hypothetical protein [Candidatus Hydrogenedentota bacterium]
MLFFRRKKNAYPAVASRSGRPGADLTTADASGRGESAPFIRIEFDMMRKGHIVHRRGRKVRQYLVSVDGSTRLVTSGDVVDRATYEALVAAGCVVPEASSRGPASTSESPPEV